MDKFKGNFMDERFIDEAIGSVESFEEVESLCSALEHPESLKKKQKERLINKLIKHSETYAEVSKVKDYYAEILQYSLTNKQNLRLIEKLVLTSTDDYQLQDTKKYARSKGLATRYMKVLFKKRIAEAMNE